MSSKRKLSRKTFQQQTCCLCGINETSQFFGINDNFVNFCGVFYSFREILADALDYNINHTEGKLMEICLDCKDKVTKFYHFKRKIKEIQQSNSDSQLCKTKSLRKDKRSKLVQDIYQIIETYIEKCSIVKINVEENSKKLIVESALDDLKIEEDTDYEKVILFTDHEATLIKPEAILIKEEPIFLTENSSSALKYIETSKLNESESSDFNDSTFSNYSPVPKKRKTRKRNVKKPVIVESIEKKVVRRKPSSKKIFNSQTSEDLQEFQNLIFTKSLADFHEYFEVSLLKFHMKLTKTVFTDTKFSKVFMYRAKCKMCGSLMWTHLNTASSLIIHLRKHGINKVIERGEKEESTDAESETESDDDEDDDASLDDDGKPKKRKILKVPDDFSLEKFQDCIFAKKNMNINKFFKITDAKFNESFSTAGKPLRKFPYVTSYTIKCLLCDKVMKGRLDGVKTLKNHLIRAWCINQRTIQPEDIPDPENDNENENCDDEDYDFNEMVICEVTGEKVPMCETPKYLEEFQNLVFSNSSGYFQDHFDIVSLKFNPKLLKTIFPGTKFSKVTMYRAKCRDCDVMIWSYANTSSALIVHLKKHIQIEDIKKDEKSVNNVKQKKRKIKKVPESFTIEQFQEYIFSNRKTDFNKFFKITDVKFNEEFSTAGTPKKKFPYVTSYTLKCLSCDRPMKGRLDTMKTLKHHLVKSCTNKTFIAETNAEEK